MFDPYEQAGMSVVSPSGWGAAKDYDSWNYGVRDTVRYFVHWPGSSFSGDEAAALRGYEEYHVDKKGWLGIAYDWAIGPSGTLYRLRGRNRSAATSGDIDEDGVAANVQGDAVLFIVSLDGVPTGAQLNTFREMWAVRPMPVYGHRDVFLMSGTGTKTECPGDVLYDLIRNGFYNEGIIMSILNELSEDRQRWLVDFVNRSVDLFGMSPTSTGHVVELLRAIAEESGVNATDEDAIADWLADVRNPNLPTAVGEHSHEATVYVSVGEVK